jgi:hypothetical protein
MMASEAQVEVVYPTSPTVTVLGHPAMVVTADPILTVVILNLRRLLL